jgi:HD superfamily phosphohydrolase
MPRVLIFLDNCVGPITIPRNGPEYEILDSIQFNLLHHVKQHGFSHSLQTNAIPTLAFYDISRFEHSLGTYGIATRYVEESNPKRREIRISALVHDIGYTEVGALSHSSEKRKGEHEEKTKKLIRNGEIAEILERHGFDPKEIAELTRSAHVEWCDRFDYVTRDSHKTNTPIDAVHLVYLTTILNDQLHLIENDEEYPAVSSNFYVGFVNFRYCLADNYYFSDGARSLSGMYRKLREGTKSLKPSFKFHLSSDLFIAAISGNEYHQKLAWEIQFDHPYPLLLKIDHKDSKNRGLLRFREDSERVGKFEDDFYADHGARIVVDTTIKMKPLPHPRILTQDDRSVPLEEYEDGNLTKELEYLDERLQEVDDFRVYGEIKDEEIKSALVKELEARVNH